MHTPLLPVLMPLAAATTLLAQTTDAPGSLRFEGSAGPGKGKHVVLLAGDEEYRSEEALPMLAKILANHHGFRCTVVLPLAADGTIDPNRGDSMPLPAALDEADAIVMSLRFRAWPDSTMEKLDAALRRGVPVVGLRTSTHAFRLPNSSQFARYNRFGKEVLGEQWVSHWGKHGTEGTRAIAENAAKDHPLLRGVAEIHGDTDVYEASPPPDATILLRGIVTATLEAGSPAAKYEKSRSSGGKQDINDPPMPVAWCRERKNEAGKEQRIVCTTMGAATDLADENLRRFVVNAVYWGLGLEVPARAEAAIVGEFRPSRFGFNGFRKALRPADLR